MSFRLSENIKPTNYDLFFEVDLKKFMFSGNETIDLRITKPESKIILHSSELKITKVKIIREKEELKPKIKFDKENELLILNFSKKIEGDCSLHIEFTGQLNDMLLGFYRSKYTAGKKEKYMATTQFEAPYARRAFPCFDEPDYKATFDITLKFDKGLTAISNMPAIEENKEGTKKVVKFDKSPKMSTYLLYFAVGEFDFVEDKLDNVKIRVYSTPGKGDQCRFALDLTKKFLDYFQDYSGIKYPLPKLDMIALPDFAAGAMENWGAITYREVYLLYDPKMTSVPVKKRIAMIIAHELWHQWSGNLVTMKWWNDLWLNESFATFMAYKCVDHFFPEWKIWEDFIRTETDHAFSEDSLKNTHAIEVVVKDVHQIEEIFDAISYSKGGSILRMIETYLGQEEFRKGVSDYLDKYRYENASSEDLWDCLSEASKKPIEDIAMSWINQAGHPVVEVERKGDNLIFTQKRFAFNLENEKELWMIPLVIKSESGEIIDLFDKKRKEIEFKNDGWFKINHCQSGFYAVKYKKEDIRQFKDLISKKIINPEDRWGLQNDLFALCLNGDIGLDEYFNFIKYYENEDSYIVLSSIYSSLRTAHFIFSKEEFWNDIWPEFKVISKKTFEKNLNRLGWLPTKNESQQDSLLRDLSIRYLAFTEDSKVLKEAEEKFNNYIKKKGKIHPDIKSAIFVIAAANGNEKVYKNMKKLYSKTKSPEEKRIIMASLGQFRNESILKKVLDFSLTDKVRKQDLIFLLSSVAANPYSRNILLPWFKKNWKKIESYKKSGKIFIHIVEDLIGAYVTKDKEAELKKFFRQHPVKYKFTLDRSFERLERRINLLEKNKTILAKYFKNA